MQIEIRNNNQELWVNGKLFKRAIKSKIIKGIEVDYSKIGHIDGAFYIMQNSCKHGYAIIDGRNRILAECAKYNEEETIYYLAENGPATTECEFCKKESLVKDENANIKRIESFAHVKMEELKPMTHDEFHQFIGDKDVQYSPRGDYPYIGVFSLKNNTTVAVVVGGESYAKGLLGNTEKKHFIRK